MSPTDRPGGRRHDPETAEEVTSIIEAAERAASALIDKADAEARRYLAEAEAAADRAVAGRLAGLLETAGGLSARAAEVRRDTEALLAQLRGFSEEALADAVPGGQAPGGWGAADAGSDPGQAAGGPAAPFQASHLSAVPAAEATPLKPVPEPAGEPDAAAPAVPAPPGERSRSAAGARLLATQLAVAGSSREEIEARLRSGFEIEDTAPILDAILGPED